MTNNNKAELNIKLIKILADAYSAGSTKKLDELLEELKALIADRENQLRQQILEGLPELKKPQLVVSNNPEANTDTANPPNPASLTSGYGRGE